MGEGNEDGFTLIEILVALAIAAVVIVSAYTLLFTVKKGTAGLYEKMREKEQAFGLLSMIRKEVESIYYARDREYTGIKIEEKDFYGKPASRLTFTCFFRDGIKVISYAVVEDNDGRLNLIKTIADVIKGGKPIRITVLKDIEGFSAQVLDEGYDRVYDSAKLRKVPKDVKISLLLKGDKGGEAFSQICSLMLNDEQ
ncbi:MAG: prepilin-type N-terminal cleavage/methylation domain-containing protein [Nitrospirae bacterium]|nr:prepilin-type N-terminal cleavage/methylation domain-containing protein [Nitrospirota bacterium]